MKKKKAVSQPKQKITKPQSNVSFLQQHYKVVLSCVICAVFMLFLILQLGNNTASEDASAANAPSPSPSPAIYCVGGQPCAPSPQVNNNGATTAATAKANN